MNKISDDDDAAELIGAGGVWILDNWMFGFQIYAGRIWSLKGNFR